MVVPNNLTEEEVLSVINNVANRLASKFKFGFHTNEDMKQEVCSICIESLEAYDGVRPLENFLYICAHNGLFNIKRKFMRPNDKPCLNCPLNAYDPHCAKSLSQCTAFDDKQDCEAYVKWEKRVSAKQNVMYPVDIMDVNSENEKSMKIDGKPAEEVMDQSEIFRLIDKFLPVELRQYYIKMKNGSRVQKCWRLKVNEAILEILKENEISG